MAKKTSLKDQIYQQIANSHVQQALNQQRQDENAKLMADFDSFMKQQQNPEAILADFNSWKQQNTQPQQTAQRIPNIADMQPKRDLQAEAKEYFANVRKERKEEKRREKAFKNNAEDYLKQQQEENILASEATKRSKEQIAKNIVKNKTVDKFVPQANVQDQNGINDYRKALLRNADTGKAKKTEAVLDEKRATKEDAIQKQLNAIPESAIEQYAQSKGISIETARAEVEEGVRKANAMNTTIAPTKESKIDKETTEKAQAIAAEQKRKANQKQQTSYEAALNNAGDAITGVVNGPIRLAGIATGNDWDLVGDERRERVEQANEQHPVASGIGRIAGMAAAAYYLGGGSKGTQAGAAGTTAGDALTTGYESALVNGATKSQAMLEGAINAGRQIAVNTAKAMPVDLATDIIPTLANDIASDKSIPEIIKDATINTLINGGMDSIGDVVSMIKPFKAIGSSVNKSTLDELIEATKNLPANNTDDLSKQLPVFGNEYDLTRNINNQFSELMKYNQPETSAMRNIYRPEDLDNAMNKQLADAIRQNSIADDVKLSDIEAKNIEPEPVKEAVKEVTKRGPELSAETQEQIASDFEEIYNAMEDMRSIVESSGDAKIAEKYSKMQDAVWNYEKLVYNSDSLEEINKAKKAADAARQGFIRAAKKIDPNFKGSLTGTKLGNAEFRRTSTAPIDDALSDELVADWVKNDIENPNRFAQDISKENVPENTKKTYSSEELKELDKYEKDFWNVKDSMLTLNRDTNAYHKKVYEQRKEYLDYITEPIRKKYPELFDKAGDFKGVPSEGAYKLQTFAGGDTPKESWKTSQYYENSAKKRGYADKLNEADYRYRQTNAQEQLDTFKTRHKDSKDIVRDLVETDAFDDADMRGAMDTMDKLMNGSIDDIRKGSRLGKKISLEGREGGRVVQAMYDAKLNTPTGQLRQAQQKIGEAIDKRVGKGTSEALDNLYEKVAQAYDKAKNKDEFAKKLKELLNGDLKKYASKKTAVDMDSKNIRGLNKIIKMLDKAESLEDVPIDDLMEVMYKANGGLTLSPKVQKEIYDLLNQASKFDPESYEFRQLQAKAARKVMAEVPAGLGDYIRTFLYDNMLGNFKTAFSRNFIGNVAYQSLEKIRELPSAGVDKLVSLKTGKHSSLGWNKGKAGAYAKGFKKGAQETLGDIKSGVNTTRSGQTGWKETLNNNRTVHNDNKKLGHLANQIDFYVENAMKGGDRPIYEANYAEFKTELEQMLDRYGKNGVVGLENIADEDIPEVIDKIAAVRAADAVFQKKGHMSEGLTKLRDGLGELSRGALGVDILSTASSPFTLTPGNMLEKAIEYTPLGAIKNVAETAKELSAGKFNQRRFAEEAGRTITGLPVLAAAYVGAKKGIINGGLSTDPDEKQAQLDDGFIEYGLNIGDKTYDTSDLPVYGPFMQAGAVMNENGVNPSSMLQAGEAVLGGSATQGIRRVFGGDTSSYSSQDSILNNLKNTVLSSGSQFIPSLARQTAQTIDPYKRDLGEYGTLDYYLNLMKNSDPVGRQSLPIKHDVEGKPVLQNQGRNLGSKILENYVLPMNMSKYEQSPLNQEASRLLTEAGTPMAFVPKAARKDLRNWDDKAGKEYSEEQFREYKKNLGTLNSEAGHAVIDSDFYQSLDATKQAQVLSDTYSAMKSIAKENATGIPTEDKIAIAYKEGNIEGMINYLAGKSAAKEAGYQTNSTVGKAIMEMAESGDTEAATDLASQTKLLPNYGLDQKGPEATYSKAYSVYDGLSAQDFANTYKAIDTDHNQGLLKAEVVGYMDRNNMSQPEGNKFWQAYAKTKGSNAWKLPKFYIDEYGNQRWK